MTSLEIFLIVWYAAGATLAYGLLMGSWMVEQAEKRGVTRGHIFAICLYASTSWFFALFWIWITLMGSKRFIFSWNMGRLYPAHPQAKEAYIQKYGAIK
jgi:hypothetical protein